MQVDWTHIDGLAHEYGPSFYLVDLEQFKQNVQRFLAAFRRHYPHTNIGHSYKTNYLPPICTTAHELGAYAEVVSGMEYQLARGFGVPGSRIIFNGPIKLYDELETALLARALVNCDSLTELERIALIANSYPDRQFNIGLRCTFDAGREEPSRFGIDARNGDLEYAFGRMGEVRNCRIVGLHSHFSGPDRSLPAFEKRLDAMLELSQRFFVERPPEFIDVGGGFCGRIPPEIRGQLSYDPPSYEDYGETIGGLMAEAFPDGEGPELIVEPGIGIVADTMMLVSRVDHVKSVAQRNLAVCHASVYTVKPLPGALRLMEKMFLPLKVLPNPDLPEDDRAAGPVEVVGYTCMEIDRVFTAYSDSLGPGDYLVFKNMGAYTIEMTPPFIRMPPPVVGWDAERRQFYAIRRESSIEDLLRPYSRLKHPPINGPKLAPKPITAPDSYE